MSSGILHRPCKSGKIRREGRAIDADPTGTIPIVDGSKSSARLFDRLLTRDGHRLCFARDGAEALEPVARDHQNL
jgi:hypothetical protein